MLKKYVFEIAAMPKDLGKAMTSTLAHEASALGKCNRDPHEIRELLMGDGDLSQFDLATSEHQRLYYDASKVKRTEAGLGRWVQRRLLKGYDAAARDEIATQLKIEDLDMLAQDLVDLNGYAPDVVTKLLEGRVGEAALLVAADGYGDKPESDLTFDDVMTLIGKVARLWIANDLQMEAAAAFVRIFRPTGSNILDGVYYGKAPINRTVVNSIMGDVELFEKTARLYFGELEGKRRKAILAQVATPSSAVAVIASPSFVLAQPYATIRKVGRDATLEEVAEIRNAGDLEVRAQVAYALWRQKHAGELEEFIRYWMERGRFEVQRLRQTLERLEGDESKIRQPVFKRDANDPLVRLWLACERAVAWTEIAPRKPLEGAIEAVRGNREVNLPRLSPRSALNVRRANRLFFVLRCAVARDPNHLPKGLCSVVTADGAVKVAANRHDAEAVRGEPFTFAEIQAFQESRMPKGSERNSKEIYSHDYTTPGRKLAAEHRAHPTPESKAIDEQAWGTLLWRLGVMVAA
jgi:hypothetical protein